MMRRSTFSSPGDDFSPWRKNAGVFSNQILSGEEDLCGGKGFLSSTGWLKSPFHISNETYTRSLGKES